MQPAVYNVTYCMRALPRRQPTSPPLAAQVSVVQSAAPARPRWLARRARCPRCRCCSVVVGRPRCCRRRRRYFANACTIKVFSPASSCAQKIKQHRPFCRSHTDYLVSHGSIKYLVEVLILGRGEVGLDVHVQDTQCLLLFEQLSFHRAEAAGVPGRPH